VVKVELFSQIKKRQRSPEGKIAKYLKNLFNVLKLPPLFIPAQVHPLVGKS
jgi:hypothetical protein